MIVTQGLQGTTALESLEPSPCDYNVKTFKELLSELFSTYSKPCSVAFYHS